MLASRSGMMAGMKAPGLPMASGSFGNGCLKRNSIVRSSAAEISSARRTSSIPSTSRLPQRLRLAAQSRASTGSPS